MWIPVAAAVIGAAITSVVAPFFKRVNAHDVQIAQIRAGQMTSEELAVFRSAVIAIARLETTLQASGLNDMRRELTTLQIKIAALEGEVRRESA